MLDVMNRAGRESHCELRLCEVSAVCEGHKTSNFLLRPGRSADLLAVGEKATQQPYCLKEFVFVTSSEQRLFYRTTCSPAIGAHCLTTPFCVFAVTRVNEFTAEYSARNL